MAKLRQVQSVENKQKLSGTLKSWLPILHSSLADLGEVMNPFVEVNPLIEVKSGYEDEFKKSTYRKTFSHTVSNSRTDQIEALTIADKSLYDVLDEQLEAPLFPTPISQKIARYIVSNLDDFGYYEGDTEEFCQKNSIEIDFFEKIRLRFAYIEPLGIGAKNLAESFLFQLDDSQIDDKAYPLAVKIINDLEHIHSYSKQKYFSDVMHTLATFNNPPNLAFQEESLQIIPDLMIYFNDDNQIEVKLNDSYYPKITIDADYGVKHNFVKEKIREAKLLVDALDMRKATLYKVGLMIVEYQYDFFTGGQIMPLTLKILADELGHNPSTISRAIANKYIACERGIFSMKEFFTTALEEDISNRSIKEFLISFIKNEDRKKPLSDMKLLSIIQDKFKVKIGRRTIAKYRIQLDIPNSSERKKLYKLGLS